MSYHVREYRNSSGLILDDFGGLPDYRTVYLGRFKKFDASTFISYTMSFFVQVVKSNQYYCYDETILKAI
jgi:hypothetical protein